MKQYKEEIWILLTRILSKEATRQEQQMFEEWLAKDSENRSFYHKLKEVYDEEFRDNSHLFDFERGLRKLRAKISESEKSEINQFAIPLKNKSKSNAWKVAASVLLLVVSLAVFVTIQFWESPKVSYSTSGMEQRIINLPDGSTVRLNKNSEIEFPEGFSNESRDITLHGEAFFKVEEDKKRPFKIYLENGVVEVLGTAFSIKEMENNRKTMVAVREGLVSFSNKSVQQRKEVKLSAGQMGLLDVRNSTIRVEDEKTSIQNYFSWMDGKLAFQEMPFNQVCSQLERIYEISCQLQDKSLHEFQLTVYTENLHLNDVLNTIAISLDIEYERSGNKIVWSNN
ncbi:FecR domain-containing protein [Aliifodinibius sp. S!AR15-10]|uniref:FecR family protein n=1 Tax=Aliifodinibius sp. S!AR15-10 TaxID=2950437 RepID=UPI002867489E|nr:FecR domain-containing protein [Aliifodinibius sp. S!AR15-10]MDR8389696.1 FecR domain-containing protein [Aliifodinibius sp. S!AR15-10]